jgi:hypothetical protein
MDEKFGYDAFKTLGFDTWKNAYLALPKHDGKIHNQYRTEYEDFDDQRRSVKYKVKKYTKDVVIKYETCRGQISCIPQRRFLRKLITD